MRTYSYAVLAALALLDVFTPHFAAGCGDDSAGTGKTTAVLPVDDHFCTLFCQGGTYYVFEPNDGSYANTTKCNEDVVPEGDQTDFGDFRWFICPGTPDALLNVTGDNIPYEVFGVCTSDIHDDFTSKYTAAIRTNETLTKETAEEVVSDLTSLVVFGEVTCLALCLEDDVCLSCDSTILNSTHFAPLIRHMVVEYTFTDLSTVNVSMVLTGVATTRNMTVDDATIADTSAVAFIGNTVKKLELFSFTYQENYCLTQTSDVQDNMSGVTTVKNAGATLKHVQPAGDTTSTFCYVVNCDGIIKIVQTRPAVLLSPYCDGVEVDLATQFDAGKPYLSFECHPHDTTSTTVETSASATHGLDYVVFCHLSTTIRTTYYMLISGPQVFTRANGVTMATELQALTIFDAVTCVALCMNTNVCMPCDSRVVQSTHFGELVRHIVVDGSYEENAPATMDSFVGSVATHVGLSVDCTYVPPAGDYSSSVAMSTKVATLTGCGNVFSFENDYCTTQTDAIAAAMAGRQTLSASGVLQHVQPSGDTTSTFCYEVSCNGAVTVIQTRPGSFSAPFCNSVEQTNMTEQYNEGKPLLVLECDVASGTTTAFVETSADATRALNYTAFCSADKEEIEDYYVLVSSKVSQDSNASDSLATELAALTVLGDVTCVALCTEDNVCMACDARVIQAAHFAALVRHIILNATYEEEAPTTIDSFVLPLAQYTGVSVSCITSVENEFSSSTPMTAQVATLTGCGSNFVYEDDYCTTQNDAVVANMTGRATLSASGILQHVQPSGDTTSTRCYQISCDGVIRVIQARPANLYIPYCNSVEMTGVKAQFDAGRGFLALECVDGATTPALLETSGSATTDLTYNAFCEPTATVKEEHLVLVSSESVVSISSAENVASDLTATGFFGTVQCVAVCMQDKTCMSCTSIVVSQAFFTPLIRHFILSMSAQSGTTTQLANTARLAASGEGIATSCTSAVASSGATTVASKVALLTGCMDAFVYEEDYCTTQPVETISGLSGKSTLNNQNGVLQHTQPSGDTTSSFCYQVNCSSTITVVQPKPDNFVNPDCNGVDMNIFSQQSNSLSFLYFKCERDSGTNVALVETLGSNGFDLTYHVFCAADSTSTQYYAAVEGASSMTAANIRLFISDLQQYEFFASVECTAFCTENGYCVPCSFSMEASFPWQHYVLKYTLPDGTGVNMTDIIVSVAAARSIDATCVDISTDSGGTESDAISTMQSCRQLIMHNTFCTVADITSAIVDHDTYLSDSTNSVTYTGGLADLPNICFNLSTCNGTTYLYERIIDSPLTTAAVQGCSDASRGLTLSGYAPFQCDAEVNFSIGTAATLASSSHREWRYVCGSSETQVYTFALQIPSDETLSAFRTKLLVWQFAEEQGTRRCLYECYSDGLCVDCVARTDGASATHVVISGTVDAETNLTFANELLSYWTYTSDPTLPGAYCADSVNVLDNATVSFCSTTYTLASWTEGSTVESPPGTIVSILLVLLLGSGCVLAAACGAVYFVAPRFSENSLEYERCREAEAGEASTERHQGSVQNDEESPAERDEVADAEGDDGSDVVHDDDDAMVEDVVAPGVTDSDDVEMEEVPVGGVDRDARARFPSMAVPPDDAASAADNESTYLEEDEERADTTQKSVDI